MGSGAGSTPAWLLCLEVVLGLGSRGFRRSRGAVCAGRGCSAGANTAVRLEDLRAMELPGITLSNLASLLVDGQK